MHLAYVFVGFSRAADDIHHILRRYHQRRAAQCDNRTTRPAGSRIHQDVGRSGHSKDNGHITESQEYRRGDTRRGHLRYSHRHILRAPPPSGAHQHDSAHRYSSSHDTHRRHRVEKVLALGAVFAFLMGCVVAYKFLGSSHDKNSELTEAVAQTGGTESVAGAREGTWAKAPRPILRRFHTQIRNGDYSRESPGDALLYMAQANGGLLECFPATRARQHVCRSHSPTISTPSYLRTSDLSAEHCCSDFISHCLLRSGNDSTTVPPRVPRNPC